MRATLRKIAELSASLAGPRTQLRALWMLAAFACATMLCSCEPELSVHKLYTSDDIVFDPALLGTWIMPAAPDTQEITGFEFTRATPDGYTITVNYQEYPNATTESYAFAAHLVNLHGTLFIDAVPLGSPANGHDTDGPAGIPGHFFGRLSITGDVMKMSFLDDDWVASHIKAHDLDLDSEEEHDQSVVLTASTPDLQQLVLDHADDDQAFSVVLDDLKRQPTAPTNVPPSGPH